jgi:hypothetical protein
MFGLESHTMWLVALDLGFHFISSLSLPRWSHSWLSIAFGSCHCKKEFFNLYYILYHLPLPSKFHLVFSSPSHEQHTHTHTSFLGGCDVMRCLPTSRCCKGHQICNYSLWFHMQWAVLAPCLWTHYCMGEGNEWAMVLGGRSVEKIYSSPLLNQVHKSDHLHHMCIIMTFLSVQLVFSFITVHLPIFIISYTKTKSILNRVLSR